MHVHLQQEAEPASYNVPPLQPGEAPLPWTACNSRGIVYSYDSLATSVLPVHRKLLDAGKFGSFG